MTRKDQASPVDPEASAKGAGQGREKSRALYTPEQRVRRDQSVWTVIQGVLAPMQFLVFMISLALVIRTLNTGEGAYAADVMFVLKTLFLYTIMVTGAIWEKVVFGKYLFAKAFFWEDVFSMLVIALHTLYLVMLFGAYGTIQERLVVALAAYGAYVINAGQFIWKLRMARLEGEREARSKAAESVAESVDRPQDMAIAA
ncbi:2-vinyl bacteriochlorophyllide hydratase [Erythrobacter dokdonensis]|uniref:2-vinyl bacteriochlorophyllide hydratase n=1 Tax=Erythrobacter dokdonensis DSW-74 TaxID=1300349 RepID=A0A1A7BD22_9SPHN|nr:2-vinyl bacteriochlorophyllide hydratase [Erythrobacter dokdonensis]OBV10423.1 2-vinyl bacteriochlorophyllide hydratase [Erythrobacter dokdonensis DSW-74]